MENTIYKRLDDSQMDKQFKDYNGVLRTRPSLEDLEETIGCATEPQCTIPEDVKLIEYKSSLSDFLGSVGMVPSKTVYDVTIIGLKKDTIKLRSRRPMISDLEKTIKDTESNFMRYNKISENKMNADITYFVKAISGEKEVEIPRSIYKSLTTYGKKSSKSTICY
jgi:hypothetical protein